MTLDCTIDGKMLSLSVNSSKPLLQILSEDVDNNTLTSNCHGDGCGNCLVLVNGYAVLSCMVPAFRLKDADIELLQDPPVPGYRTRLPGDRQPPLSQLLRQQDSADRINPAEPDRGAPCGQGESDAAWQRHRGKQQAG